MDFKAVTGRSRKSFHGAIGRTDTFNDAFEQFI